MKKNLFLLILILTVGIVGCQKHPPHTNGSNGVVLGRAVNLKYNEMIALTQKSCKSIGHCVSNYKMGAGILGKYDLWITMHAPGDRTLDAYQIDIFHSKVEGYSFAYSYGPQNGKELIDSLKKEGLILQAQSSFQKSCNKNTGCEVVTVNKKVIL